MTVHIVMAREGMLVAQATKYGTVNLAPDWASDIDLSPDEARTLGQALLSAAAEVKSA